jgi:hypothetical protein
VATEHDLLFGPNNSSAASERQTAIDRYLTRNLSTAADTRAFFDAWAGVALLRGTLPLLLDGGVPSLPPATRRSLPHLNITRHNPVEASPLLTTCVAA